MRGLILAQSPDIQNTGLLICILHGIKRDALQALQPSALPSVELQIPGCDIPGHLVQAYSVEITYSLLHPVLLYNQAEIGRASCRERVQRTRREVAGAGKR